MERYVAFLRGVSPMNCKMPELKPYAHVLNLTGSEPFELSGLIVEMELGERPLHDLHHPDQQLAPGVMSQPVVHELEVVRVENQKRAANRCSVAAGELPAGVDPDALARAVEVTVSGSLMAWAFHQEGRAGDWVLHDLDAVVGAFAGAARDHASA